MISNVIFSPWCALHGNLQKACRMEIASWLQLLISEEWAVLGELEILTHVSCCSIISHAIGAFAAFYIALPFTSYPHGCGVRGSHHVTACGRIMHETHCLGLRAPGQCQLHRPWVGPDGSQLQRHSSRPVAETGAANLAGQGPAGALAVPEREPACNGSGATGPSIEPPGEGREAEPGRLPLRLVRLRATVDLPGS